LKCNFSDNQRAWSAYNETNSTECKNIIENTACYYKVIDTLPKSVKQIQLKSSCPLKRQESKGCLNYAEMNQFLQNSMPNDLIKVDNELVKSKELCLDNCLTHFGYHYGIYAPIIDNKLNSSCVCIQKLPKEIGSLNMKVCERIKTKGIVYSVYSTGFIDYGETRVHLNDDIRNKITKSKLKDLYSVENTMPRIVYFIIVNERDYERQIMRLLRTIYNEYDYYYIHIDKVFSKI
jgi:hypothetical protein